MRCWPSSAAFLRIFHRIGPDECLPNSRYTVAERGMDPLSSPCCGQRHRGHQLKQQGECDAVDNIPRGFWQWGGQRSKRTTARYQWSYDCPPFHGEHLWTQTSKKNKETTFEPKSLMPHKSLMCSQGKVPWVTYPQDILWDIKMGKINPNLPPWRSKSKRPLGEKTGMFRFWANKRT